jgi:molybdopterin-containing oxidoreductase family molybdopterin binding subunit
MNATRAWMNNLDFVVTIDPFNNPSVEFSDLVLPVCTKFECRGDYGYLTSARGLVYLQQKILDPLFESWTDFELDHAIAGRFVDASLLPKNQEELTRFRIEQSEDPLLENITIESLMAHNAVEALPVPNEPIQLYPDLVFPSPTTKLELYYEAMLEYGMALPTFEEPFEAATDSVFRGDYPLQFGQPRSKYFLHSQFQNANWITQFFSPRVELNPLDGESRGLVNGDVVEVFNGRGSLTCAYWGNAAVRPGTARSIEGSWPKYLEGGAVQEVTNGALVPRGFGQMYGPTIPFNDTLVEVRKAGGPS